MNQKYLIPILTLIAIIGSITGFTMEPQLVKPPKQSSILLPPDFLTSPALDSLYANTEGKVIQKGENYMVLQKENQKLRILIEEGTGLTTFGKKSNQGLSEIGFKDIKIGDYLKGGISIVVKSTMPSQSKKVGDVVGHRFTVVTK